MESRPTRHGLNWLNFFVAALQTGFGPFVSVYLTQQLWSQTDIGLVLSLGTGAALLGQLPAGALVDALHRKRPVTTLALAAIGASALMLAARPSWSMILGGQLLHALASCVLMPAIAAITLSLCGHHAYSERLGVNARYASLGNAAGAVLLGFVASWLSERSVFLLTAGLSLPAIASLYAIHAGDRRTGLDEHPAIWRPQERRRHNPQPWYKGHDPGILIFGACAMLFQLGNAAMLPLALNTLSGYTTATGLVISATILLPTLIAAAWSPWVGNLAQHIGRRPVLLAGFAAVPLRGMLLAVLFLDQPSALVVVALQVLDGISAMVFGLMQPLIAADLTQRNGLLNLTISWFAVAAGLGAMFSTTLGGWIADRVGIPAAFLALAAAGALAVVLVWLGMPESRPTAATTKRPAPAAA